MRLITKSPTRVDLAGGTLDLWPIYSFLGDCFTINLSIDIWTEAELIIENREQGIEIEIVDLNYQKKFDGLSEVIGCEDPQLVLIKSCLQYLQPKFGFKLKTKSESPIGGGLGGSSSLTISILKSFLNYEEIGLGLEELVTVAHNVEARVLHTPTGTQDYFPAASPGLSIIEYDCAGPTQTHVPFDSKYFAQHMFLVDTGKSHHSGLNNWSVLKAAVEKDKHTLRQLGVLKDIAEEMKEACQGSHWNLFPKIFKKETEARISLSEGFVSDEISQLKKLVLENSAGEIKICGAGGGGCVLVWSEPDQKENLIQTCSDAGYAVLKVNPVDHMV